MCWALPLKWVCVAKMKCSAGFCLFLLFVVLPLLRPRPNPLDGSQLRHRHTEGQSLSLSQAIWTKDFSAAAFHTFFAHSPPLPSSSPSPSPLIRPLSPSFTSIHITMANLNKLGLNERQQVFLVVAFYMASILFVLIVAQFFFLPCCTLEWCFFAFCQGSIC